MLSLSRLTSKIAVMLTCENFRVVARRSRTRARPALPQDASLIGFPGTFFRARCGLFPGEAACLRECGLRHTFASRLVMSGVDLRTVQDLMGHKTIQMTVRYARLAPQHRLVAVQRLCDTEAAPNGLSDTTTDTATQNQPPLGER